MIFNTCTPSITLSIKMTRAFRLKILIVSKSVIPVFAYGGTERVIWDLGFALTKLGHDVTYLVAQGSTCEFAKVIHIDEQKDLREQIPSDIDIVHFQFKPDFHLDESFSYPYVFTEHGNTDQKSLLPLNTVFVSRNHALRHQSEQFVYNGLNWDAYGEVDFDVPRTHYHFLGKAAWRVKNVVGAIDTALEAKVKLAVMGGTRLNLKRGFRFTWSRKIEFHGMVGGEKKLSLLNASNGLIFPVRWHEPFGLAIIESLYFGCPVFSTTYGSLPELVPENYGYLSSSATDLANAIQTFDFDRRDCHVYALENFNAEVMAKRYVQKYEKVLAGDTLNKTAPRSAPIEQRLPWQK